MSLLLLYRRGRRTATPLVATPAYASVATGHHRGSGAEDDETMWTSAKMIHQRNYAVIHLFMGLVATGELD